MAGISSNYHGSIVALEGSVETVSTQLRLLPSSPKILVLPPFQHFMARNEEDSPFDARSCILKTHEASCARLEKAYAFLRQSTSDDKRIVFMNGGAPSARMTCIALIGKYDHDGDIVKAATSFDELIQHGVAELRKNGLKSMGTSHSHKISPLPKKKTTTQQAEYIDRMPAAIRAADAVYFETASLQPNTDIDLPATKEKRSKSVLNHDGPNDSTESSSVYTSVAQNLYHEPVSSVTTLKSTYENSLTPQPFNLEAFRPRAILDDSILHRRVGHSSPRWTTKQYRLSVAPSNLASNHIFTSQSPTFGPPPDTPTFIFEDVHLVNGRTCPQQSMNQQHRRSQMVDCDQSVSARNSDRYSVTSTLLSQSDGESDFGTVLSYHHRKPPLWTEDHTEHLVNACTTTDKANLSRPPPLALHLSAFLSTRERGTYVDKGTSPSPGPSSVETPLRDRAPYVDSIVGAADDLSLLSSLDSSEGESPFEVALPLYEDLVIHLDDKTNDKALRQTFAKLLNQLYAHSTSGTEEPKRRPLSDDNPSIVAGFCNPNSTLSLDYLMEGHNHTLFEAHSSNLAPPSPNRLRKCRKPSNRGAFDAPQTPARTQTSKSFHQMRISKGSTALEIQNSLRSTLNRHFSHHELGFKYPIFPLLPELGCLLNPVLQEVEETVAKKGTRKLDLIVAIGAQKGVERDFLSAVACALENLAARPGGIAGSARLDLRDLIVEAMQSYTCLPSAKHTRDNAFTSSTFLATLIVPYLRTYLATHDEIFFLTIEYPAEYLATVVALQELVGVDLLKIAGIVRADSPEAQAVFKSSSLASLSTSLSTSLSVGVEIPSLSSTYSTQPKTETLFSEVNFILVSSATDSEVAAFISSIRKILIETSPYDIPEVSLMPASSNNDSPRYIYSAHPAATSLSLLASVTPSHAKDTAQPQELFTSSAVATCTDVTDPRAALTAPRTGTKSLSLLTRSPQSMELIHSFSKTFQKLVAPERKPSVIPTIDDERTCLTSSLMSSKHSSSYFDISEDDGWLYQQERIYVPMLLQKPDVRGGDSSKALKFLGLV